MEKEFTVKVPGLDFELSSNQVYHIREIADANAPDGYQRAGISKHPLPGIEEGIVVPHHERTNTWNTGFWDGSACYRGVSAKEKKQTIDALKKYLLPELEYLVEGDLTNGRSSNNQFFDDFKPFNGEGYGEDVSKYKIKGGNMFNTANPLEFLALWFALLGKQVMPPNKRHSGGYTNCVFVLEDKKKSTSVEQDKDFEKSIALSRVLAVVNSNDKKEISNLQNIFTYVGFDAIVAEMETKPLISVFGKWCEKGGYNNENASEFNEVFEKFEKEDNREELVVYIKLIENIKDGSVKLEGRDILINGENLGSNKKSAARKIVKDQELHKAFLLI